jgi:septation ring formation regulator EzrA
MAAVTVADTTETRLTRLESDMAHVRSDVADLKTDIREMRRDLGALRDDVRKGFDELHKELAGISKAMIRGDFMNRIWMLLMCGAMLGIVARGLHWL